MSFIYHFSIRLSARKRGSVFQIIIAESLENLIILHSQKKLSSLRNNQGWNEIYEKMTKENNNSENENNNENNDERNNNENNEENNEENKDENKNKNNNLHGNYFKNRYEKYILMNPKKRKILLKLLAVKNLLHDHGKENKYKGTEEPSLEESEERSSEWESRDMFDEYLGKYMNEGEMREISLSLSFSLFLRTVTDAHPSPHSHSLPLPSSPHTH